MKTLKERMEDKTARNAETGCLEWVGARAGAGYGYYTLHSLRKTIYIHRAVYESHFGAIPAGMVVMHKCDNPRCCEITHLSIGTMSENTNDMIKKGRQPQHMRPGWKEIKAARNDKKNARQSRK